MGSNYEIVEIDYVLFSNTPLSSGPLLHPDFHQGRISKKDFLMNVEHVIAHPIQRSILWMVARTCLEPGECDEFDQVCWDGFYKEFLATKTFHYHNQQVSYSNFHRAPNPKDPFSCKAYALGMAFAERVKKFSILFPVVNRSKNVSDSTLFQYNLYDDKDYVRTVDLEVLYHETGIQVQGACEMRMAWKFNDLKPRFYYCNGGSPYWASRYVRYLAIGLMEAIPSTFTKLRTNPSLHLSCDPNTDFITTWDFTSFTSSLAELKHFLWSISRILEREKVTLDLFDYRHGLVQCMAHDLLDQYNETVNMGDEYSIHRLLARFNLCFGEDGADHIQMNSGMLGVAGNIGFSTALHGYVTYRESGEFRGVCVGDDALAITQNRPEEFLIPALVPLGIIHPEKFGVLQPGQEEGFIKFLKRRFERVGSSFVMSVLFNFPPLPYIDAVTGHRTIPMKFEFLDRVSKISTQIGALYWEIFALGPLIVSEDEEKVLFDFINAVYHYMDLPRRGALSGAHILVGNKPYHIHFTIPPSFGFSPARTDWLEYVFQNSSEMFFELPMTAYKNRNMESLIEGHEYALPESQFLSALEDIGVVKLSPLYEMVYLADQENRRKVRNLYKRLDPQLVYLRKVEVLKEVPRVFDFMFAVSNQSEALLPLY